MQNFFINPKDCQKIYANEYLKSFPNRGKLFAPKQMDLSFYNINNCLVLSSPSQVIAPLHKMTLPIVFKESGPYLSSEEALPTNAEIALNTTKEIIDIPTAAPFFPPGADNFWHWTLESLPKLLLLEDIGYDGPYIIFEDSPVVQESLDMFKIDKKRRLKAGPIYRVENLILPPQLSGFILPENLQLVAFLREKILGVTGFLDGSKRCYIKRVGRRKIINEDAFLSVIKDFDFEVMVPENLTLIEQWKYMTNVECSIMCHGANTTLTLTQPHHSTFIEFFSNRYINYSNMQAIRLLKMRYLPIVEELDVSWYPDKTTLLYDHLSTGIPSDITVHVTHLRMHLESIFS